jgi:hypothetical protein
MPAPIRQTPISPSPQPFYVTWEPGDSKGKAVALAQAERAVRRAEPVVRSHGSSLFLNIAPNNVSVRDGMTRQDYDEFRREEAIPTKPKDVIRACKDAYDKIGIVRNVIDLMADFAAQGVDLVHPNERIEKWYKEWFRKVGGKDRSERFLNYLYRMGNVVVQRQTAKLTPTQADQLKRAQAAPDVEVDPETAVGRREVPWRYTFLNPLTVEVLGGDLAVFAGRHAFQFAVRLPDNLVRKISRPTGEAELRLIAKLPAKVVEAVRAGERLLPLDQDKVKGHYYKRDDWSEWASPMTRPILADLQVLQKMKLADLAALDGAISSIRVWRLGSMEHQIMPTEAAIARLSEVLCNNVGGGVMDLVWGPELDLVETKTDVHHFLGNTKYEPVLTAIYAGMGVPPTLTGAADKGGGGFTNNFISLKTMTERLQYGRDVLTAFWEEEIRLVQKAMGFRFPATLTFDRMVLSDEAAEKQLLINLWDRDLISDESIQERFKETPEIEEVRVRREMRKRDAGQLPPKASPFHVAEKDHQKKMAFIATKTVTPSEVGVELDEKKAGEKSPAEVEADLAPPPASTAPKGQPGQGRPKNKKDSQQRKPKRVTPRSGASFLRTFAWAETAQARIGQLAGPAYLKSLGKKTLRELSAEENRNFEQYKFFVLCQLDPGDVPDGPTLVRLSAGSLSAPTPVADLLRATVARHIEEQGQEPGLDAVRRYQAGAVAMWKAAEEDEGS